MRLVCDRMGNWGLNEQKGERKDSGVFGTAAGN